ncbi:hypothetical protein GGR58DRAFT_524336 [Xylaria digitata]|nr:hypothetical protein GGR58DRAFT_524336 [Xylaria digitata]
MQPRKPDEPESTPSGNRISSFSRFIRKPYSLTKRNKSPTPSETPKANLDVNRSVHARPQRQHIPTKADLRNHVAALQTALDGAWPRRYRSRYRNIRALLVCWPDNDSTDVSMVMGLSSSIQLSGLGSSTVPSGSSSDSNSTPLARSPCETSAMKSSYAITQSTTQGPFVPVAYQLADVLERRYEIKAQVWMIPSLESPSDMLAGKVRQFVEEYGGQDNLLIFWYGGHAEFVSASPKGDAPGSEMGKGEVIWYGLDVPGVPAKTATKALGAARADVLMLNDSPYAQHAYAGHITGPGTFELLGSGSTSPEPNTAREASFTRTLTLMLDSPFLATHGVSVLELHHKLLDMAGHSQPILRASSQKPERETALIVSRAQQTARAPVYPIYCQISQSPRLERGAHRNIVLSSLNASLAAETNYARTVGEPRVTLDFRLERQFLDVQRWKEWVLKAPEDVQEVSVKVVEKEG